MANAGENGGPRQVAGYELGETLGSGLQGKVKLGRSLETGEMVALKFIDRTKLGDREARNLNREIEVMKRVASHPNVIQLRAVHDEVQYPRKRGGFRDSIMLVLDLAQGGELFDLLLHTGSFPEAIARAYFQQLVSALAAMHSQDCFHRDLKPENLLLDGNFALKVADFGLSALHEDGEGAVTPNHTECGTRGYMAPEILSHQPYLGGPADVWSAGVVLFITLSGFPPFQIAAASDWWFRAISAGNTDAFWNAHLRSASFSQGAMDLMSKIFVADPANRATIQDIMNDPWFNAETVSQATLTADLQRRKTQVEREKRREKEAEMRRRAAAKQQQQQAEFDPFSTHTTRAVPAAAGGDGAAAAVRASEAPAQMLPAKENGIARYTCFYSQEPSAAEITGRIAQAFSAIFAQHTIDDATYKIKASLSMPGGRVQVVTQVFRHPEIEGLHVIEMRRRSGNVLSYQECFKLLCENLRDIICAPPAPVDDEDDDDAAQAAAVAPADALSLADTTEMM